MVFVDSLCKRNMASLSSLLRYLAHVNLFVAMFCLFTSSSAKLRVSPDGLTVTEGRTPCMLVLLPTTF